MSATYTFLFTASISVKYYSSYNRKNYVNFNLGFKANATPGIYPPQYTSQASNLAPGQTLDPPPNAPYPSHNGSFTPQLPPYGEPAPSYDSMFGPPGNKAPPYPTSQNEPNFVPPPAKNWAIVTHMWLMYIVTNVLECTVMKYLEPVFIINGYFEIQFNFRTF